MCRLANLPDLDQSNSFVRSTLKTWVEEQVKTFQLDGIRIDTVPEVRKPLVIISLKCPSTKPQVFNCSLTISTYIHTRMAILQEMLWDSNLSVCVL